MNDFEKLAESRSARNAPDEREIHQLLREAGPRADVPARDLAFLEEGARQQWRRLVVSAQERRRHWLAPALALAATLTLALGAVWWWAADRGITTAVVVARLEVLQGDVRLEDPASEELVIGQTLEAGVVIVTGGRVGQPARAALLLPGGQSLRLDSRTTVRLAAGDRLELERGAIYVDSRLAAAASEGIVVATAHGTVRDIGTQFEVRLASSATTTLRVRVREGAVVLDRDGDSHPAAKGEELRLGTDGSLSVGSVARHGQAWAWAQEVAPSFDLEGQTLATFLTWVGRETGWVVDYADDELAHFAAADRLFGTIEGLTPEQAVEIVLPGSGLSSELDGGTLRVERSNRE